MNTHNFDTNTMFATPLTEHERKRNTATRQQHPPPPRHADAVMGSAGGECRGGECGVGGRCEHTHAHAHTRSHTHTHTQVSAGTEDVVWAADQHHTRCQVMIENTSIPLV